MSDAPDLDLVSRRIRGLLAKTVEAGATEAEALLASAKARELMDRYRLSMSDVQMKAEPIDDVTMERPNRSKLAAVDYCMTGLGRYCGVKMWFTYPDKKVRVIRMLGLRGDVEMARYLYDMLSAVIKRESEDFILKKMESFPDLASQRQYDGRSAKVSFQVGMAQRINERLVQMAKDLEPTAKTASGTALVVVRGALVNDAFNKLGVRLAMSNSRINSRDGAAHGQGRVAGDRVNLSRPVGSANTRRIS